MKNNKVIIMFLLLCAKFYLLAENSYKIEFMRISFKGNPSKQQIQDAKKEFSEQFTLNYVPELILQYTSQESLQTFCREFPEIKKLSLLFCSEIDDLQPLLTLTDLRNLSLIGLVKIKELSVISEINSLQSLELRSLPLTDGNSLTKLNKLQKLSINIPDLDDYSFLQELSSLTSLSISGRKLTNLQKIKKLKYLQFLEINFTTSDSLDAYFDLQNLVAFRNLRQLRLFNCILDNTRYLSRLKKLSYLDLSSCEGLESLTALRVLPELRTVRLPANTFSPEELKNIRKGINIFFDKKRVLPRPEDTE